MCPELHPSAIPKLTQETIASFLTVSQAFMSHAKTDSDCPDDAQDVSDGGRPSLISRRGRQQLLQRLGNICAQAYWQTVWELKWQVMLRLEAENITLSSHSPWLAFIGPPIEKNFESVRPNHSHKAAVHVLRTRPSSISTDWADCRSRIAILAQRLIWTKPTSGSPRAARRKGRGRRPTSFKGKPIHEEVPESDFASALVVMTLQHDALNRAFITTRATGQPDAGHALHFKCTARHSTEKPFDARSLSSDDLGMVALPFVQAVQ
jgi:hypothetical protein